MEIHRRVVRIVRWRQSLARVLLLEALLTHPGFNQRPAHGEMLVAQRVIREHVYGLVAVSPQDGQLSSLGLPWVDAEAMSIFLAQTAADFPNDYCLMLLDGAVGIEALRIPSRLRRR